MSVNNTTPILADIFSFESLLKPLLAGFWEGFKPIFLYILPSLVVCYFAKKALASLFCVLGVSKRKAKNTANLIVDSADVYSTLQKK